MTTDEHAGLIEYLPGQWMTPAQCRARFAGGPIVPAATATQLAHELVQIGTQLAALAAQLIEMANTEW